LLSETTSNFIDYYSLLRQDSQDSQDSIMSDDCNTSQLFHSVLYNVIKHN